MWERPGRCEAIAVHGLLQYILCAPRAVAAAAQGSFSCGSVHLVTYQVTCPWEVKQRSAVQMPYANGINLFDAMSCSFFVGFTTLMCFPDKQLFYIPGTSVQSRNQCCKMLKEKGVKVLPLADGVSFSYVLVLNICQIRQTLNYLIQLQ